METKDRAVFGHQSLLFHIIIKFSVDLSSGGGVRWKLLTTEMFYQFAKYIALGGGGVVGCSNGVSLTSWCICSTLWVSRPGCRCQITSLVLCNDT